MLIYIFSLQFNCSFPEYKDKPAESFGVYFLMKGNKMSSSKIFYSVQYYKQQNNKKKKTFTCPVHWNKHLVTN